MPNAQNQAMMAAIKEDLDGVVAVWAVDYRGLTVKETEELRRSVRAFQRVQNEPCDPIACPHTGIPSLSSFLLTLTFFNLFFDRIIVNKRQIINVLKKPFRAGIGGRRRFVFFYLGHSQFFFDFLCFSRSLNFSR